MKALLSSSSPVLKKHHEPVPGSAILDKVSKNKVKTTFSLCLIDAKNVYFCVKNISDVINIFSLFHVGHNYISLTFEKSCFLSILCNKFTVIISFSNLEVCPFLFLTSFLNLKILGVLWHSQPPNIHGNEIGWKV